MLDIKFVRDNPDAVKENIKKKFQDAKLPLVDEVIEKDAKYRECLKEVESLKAARNKLSKANGPLFGQLKKWSAAKRVASASPGVTMHSGLSNWRHSAAYTCARPDAGSPNRAHAPLPESAWLSFLYSVVVVNNASNMVPPALAHDRAGDV